MASNLELKSSTDSLAQAHAVALGLGLRPAEILNQTDIYFDVPHGRLKLRLLAGKTAELIQYDRSDDRTSRWSTYTRHEVRDPGILQAMLSRALGVRGVVRKNRTVYLYETARIHLDSVEGLGDFLEFEIVETEENRASALMEKLIINFSIAQMDIIGESYIDLIEKRGISNPEQA